MSPFAPARQRWQVDCCSCHMISSQVLPSCVSVCSRYRVSISLKHGNIRVFSRTINACMLVPPHPPWRLKLIKPVGHDFSVRGEASHDLYMWRGGEQLLYEWIVGPQVVLSIYRTRLHPACFPTLPPYPTGGGLSSLGGGIHIHLRLRREIPIPIEKSPSAKSYSWGWGRWREY